MGKKGRNTLAITMERMLPKLEEAVILIYLDTLAKGPPPLLDPFLQHFQVLFQQDHHPPLP